MFNAILYKISNLNLYKTIFCNFYYFPFKIACRFPILIYRNVDIVKCRGSIIFNTPVKMGLLRIGQKKVGTLDHKHNKSIWEVAGKIILEGEVNIGSGSRISVGPTAVLKFGNNFSISGGSSIICQKEISFGSNCLLSWDVLIMDTDFHKIYNFYKKNINIPAPIHIGNHVWIGCRSTILKGVDVGNDIVIAAGAVVTKSLITTNSIYGANNKILKENCYWDY